MLALQQQQQLQHQLFVQHQQQQQQQQHQQQREQGGTLENSNLDDLRRFRERLSRANGGDGDLRRVSASATQTVSESDLAARSELIQQNLFVRQINREESVKELSRLLAISRGGDGAIIDEEEDEERGRGPRHVVVATKESSSDTAIKLGADCNDLEGGNDVHVPLPPSAPPPPLPPGEVTPAAETATSTNATSAMTAVGRLWRSFSQSQQSDPDIVQQVADNNKENNNSIIHNTTIHNSVPLSSSSLKLSNKIECSICLEQYSPHDIIAWAKDGGGCDAPPTFSSTTPTPSSYNTGCDHIFHRECLVAWLLQDHDECPLCRRRVVHADANVRFAGWEER